MQKLLFIALAMLAVSCRNKQSQVAEPKEVLSTVARAELKLPAVDALTIATKEDIEFVAKLNPETLKAVQQSLEPRPLKIQIDAARPIGNHLLLWISFPEIDDGGIDLIWSIEKQKSVGTFHGGYRG